MKVVALESSSTALSVAVLDTESGSEHQCELPPGRERGRALLPRLEQLLGEAGFEFGGVDIVAAGVGPGSYTGVRIGLTLACSLAWSSRAELVAVGSLEVLAAAAPAEYAARPVLAAANAFKGELFAATFLPGDPWRQAQGASQCVAPAELVASLDPNCVAVGEGAEACREVLGAQILVVDGVRPRALDLAHLAVREYARRGADDPLAVAPLHLRRAEQEFRTL